MEWLKIAGGVILLAWVLLTFYLFDAHKSDTVIISSYKTEIAQLNSDAIARAARDKEAAAEANVTVKNSETKANSVLAQTPPADCEKLRLWVIKQVQGI